MPAVAATGRRRRRRWRGRRWRRWRRGCGRAEHLRSLDDGRTLGDVLGQGLGGLVADEAVTQARDERVHALLVQHRELGQLIADLRRKQRSSDQPAAGSGSQPRADASGGPRLRPASASFGRVGRAGRPCRLLSSDRVRNVEADGVEALGVLAAEGHEAAGARRAGGGVHDRAAVEGRRDQQARGRHGGEREHVATMDRAAKVMRAGGTSGRCCVIR